MPKVSILIPISIVVYMYFAYKGAQKKYRLDIIQEAIQGVTGVESKEDFFAQSFDWFLIGIGIKEE